MADLDVVVIDGVERKLGRTPPEPQHLLMRGAMLSFSEYLETNKLSLIPRSEWKPVRNRSMFTKRFVNNQLRYGACVGASCAMAVAKKRYLSGQPFVQLSWGYIYDQINKGRDSGACITQALQVMLTDGAPLYEQYPIPVFNRQNQPPDRKRFRLAQGLTLTNFDEMGTAIQMGYQIQYPVQVGKHYNPSASTDWVCGVDQGQGNHSVHADGMDFINNQWMFDHMGSWNTTWGNEGRGWHTEGHIKGCAVEDDAFCHIDAVEDTEDDDVLPDALTRWVVSPPIAFVKAN